MRAPVIIYLDPETELQTAGACACTHCLRDYRTIVDHCVEAASNAEGRNVVIAYGPDGRNRGIAADVASVIRDMICERLRPWPCDRVPAIRHH